MQFNLGIILRDGEIVNHRSLLKVLINPFLRIIGWQIATKLTWHGADQKLGRPVFCRCHSQPLKFSFDYPLELSETVLKKRRLI